MDFYQWLATILTGLTAIGGVVLGYFKLIAQIRNQQKASEDIIKTHVETQVKKANGVPWSFIDNTPIPCWAKDINSRYLWINDEYCQQWNIKKSQFEGKTDYEVWPPDVAEEFRTNDLRVIHNKILIETIEKVPITSGSNTGDERALWRIWKFPLKDEGGKVVGVGGIAAPICLGATSNTNCPLANYLNEHANEVTPDQVIKIAKQIKETREKEVGITPVGP